MNGRNPIAGLNKLFDNRVRLGIMSVLRVSGEVSFIDLKDLLQLTDGNLATHLVSLEEAGLVRVHKGFVGRKPNTTYTITELGEKTINAHIAALENLVSIMS